MHIPVFMFHTDHFIHIHTYSNMFSQEPAVKKMSKDASIIGVES